MLSALCWKLESLELKQQMPQLAFKMLEGIGISAVLGLEVLTVWEEQKGVGMGSGFRLAFSWVWV